MKVYIDTNIILDFLWNRQSGFKPLGEYAHQFFSESIACKYELVISTHLLKELSTHIDSIHIEDFLEHISTKTSLVAVHPIDISLAKQSKYHFSDALHAQLAKKAGAEKIVPRNLSDFPKEFAILPENL